MQRGKKVDWLLPTLRLLVTTFHMCLSPGLDAEAVGVLNPARKVQKSPKIQNILSQFTDPASKISHM